MRPRALLALALTGLMVACSATLSDPKEIVLAGFDATSDLQSFHIAVVVDGEVRLPGSEGSIELTGTTIDADVNVTDEDALVSFAVPAFLGLSGQAILLGEGGGFVQTSLSGESWYRLEDESAEPSPEGSAEPSVEPIDELRAFLDREGVTVRKLDDVACGDRQCYQVELTITPEALRDAQHDAEGSADPSASAFVDPDDFVGDEDLVVILLFDRERLWLTQASSSTQDADGNTFSVELTLSAVNEPVTISPPPSDQVDASGFEFPLGE